MPAKRRRAKSRRAVSVRACEIFQANPGAIDGSLILDPDLAAELGREILIAYPDIEHLIEQLSEHRD
jgi:hypothetical protein